MTHARIPDFRQPAPLRRPVRRDTTRRLQIDGRYLNLPNEALPGEGGLWHVTAPIRPDTAHVRASRFPANDDEAERPVQAHPADAPDLSTMPTAELAALPFEPIGIDSPCGALAG